MCMIALFQAQKDTTATARSPRRSHIGALNTFETRTHPLLSFASPPPHTPSHKSPKHCPLLIVLLLNKMSLSLHTRSWIVFHSLHHPTRRGRQRHSQPSLSLSLISRTQHTQRVATLKSPLLLLSCAVSFLLPPSHSLLASSLIAKCVPSLSITLTHTLVQHTHAAHTPRKISASRRATLPWEEHSLKDKKRARDPPSSPSFSVTVSPYYLRAARLREHRLPRREVAIRRRHLRNLARRPPIRPIRRGDQLLYHRAGREVARRERA